MKKEDFVIKVEVIKDFDLNDFNKLSNIKRATNKDKKGSLYVRDTFYCSKEMAEYLTGKNDKGIEVIKVIEIIPEAKIEYS